MKYKGLCLSSGGEKGLFMLGYLDAAYKKGELEIEKYSGSSIGALICYLLSLGCTPEELAKMGLEKNIFDGLEKRKSNSTFENVMSMVNDVLNDFGMIDIENITKEAEEITLKKFGRILSMEDHFRLTGKYLCICTTNITREKTVYIDYKTFPTLSCIKALQMSCRIPFIFKKCEYKEMSYMDGGFGDPFPISKIDDGETPILGIIVHGKIPGLGNPLLDHYIMMMNTMSKIPKFRSKEKCRENCNIVEFEILESFLQPLEQKSNIYLKGLEIYDTHLLEK